MHKWVSCKHLTAWALLGVLFQYHPVFDPLLVLKACVELAAG